MHAVVVNVTVSDEEGSVVALREAGRPPHLAGARVCRWLLDPEGQQRAIDVGLGVRGRRQ